VRWAKVFAISKALEQNNVVVFVDYDVTPRPDCLGAARLLDTLFERSLTGTKPSIVVRDSPTGVDCLNTGFIAFRQTKVARAFLERWKEKMHWTGVSHGDQGAFAETLLEFLGNEYRAFGLNNAGFEDYRGQCLEYLVPNQKGYRSWRAYCDCFQEVLHHLSGPFAERLSVHIRFVNPRDVDLNFVPNSLVPDHSGQLSRMRLVASKKPQSTEEPQSQVITPLFVHWAGMDNRSELMQEYLMRRFSVPPVWFREGRYVGDRCEALSQLSPRVNPECGRQLGKLGVDIEEVW